MNVLFLFQDPEPGALSHLLSHLQSPLVPDSFSVLCFHGFDSLEELGPVLSVYKLLPLLGALWEHTIMAI